MIADKSLESPDALHLAAHSPKIIMDASVVSSKEYAAMKGWDEAIRYYSDEEHLSFCKLIVDFSDRTDITKEDS